MSSLVLSIINIGFAQNRMPSFEWQKIQLQEKLEMKVKGILGPVIGDGNFVVTVKIDAVRPKAPRPRTKKISRRKARQKKLDQSLEEKLIFSKYDFDESEFETLRDREIQDQAEQERSRIEAAQRAIDSYDIMNSLNKVEFVILLKDHLTPDWKAKTKKLLSSIDLLPDNSKANLKVDFISNWLGDGESSGKDESFNYLNWLKGLLNNQSIDLGLLLSALLLGMSIFFAAKRFASRGSEDSSSGSLSGNLNLNEKDDAKPMQLSMLGGDKDKELKGVSRFQALLHDSEEEAVILCKKWLHSGKDEEFRACCVILNELPNEDIATLFEALTDKDKAKFAQAYQIEMTEADYYAADNYLAKNILHNFIKPLEIKNTKAMDMLNDLDLKKAKKVLQKNPELGSTMLELLPASDAKELLAELEESEASGLIDTFLYRSNSHLDEDVEKIAALVGKSEKDMRIDPAKVEKVFSALDPMKEIDLLNVLARNNEYVLIEKLAREHFPYLLFPELPDNIVKDILARYPMDSKIKLFLILDKEMRSYFMKIFAPKGSNARDMIEMEIDKIKADKVLKKEIRSSKVEIMDDFVRFFRNAIDEDTVFRGSADDVLKDWLATIGKKNTKKKKKAA